MRPSDKLDVMLIPDFMKVFDAYDRRVGCLGCARVGIAAERFRRAHNNTWPQTLDQLVPEYIARIPDDPYRHGPIQMQQTEFGLIVYCVGQNGELDPEGFDPTDCNRPRGDAFFRLWDADKRGLAPP